MNRAAGFWIRLQAHIIDSALIVLTLTAPTWFIVNRSGSLEDLILPVGILLYYMVFTISPLVILYRVILTIKFGGGVGKLVSGIKVVGKDRKLLRFWPAMFRYIVGYFVSSLLYGVGFLWIVRNPNKQGWHDQVSGTYVIHDKPKRWIIGSALLIILLFVNSFLASNAVQSIKENQALVNQIQTLLKETTGSPLENDQTPATIDPQEARYII